ncbi:hypothetical protein PHYSODRAFT_299773 [Phytophthora sojae]|uniref:DUF1279 domain-containing protein n=1 Tax=Phytophthora sojae (strain P6497) TaxID=1094619 RepID=G4Z8J8_PHYSP|nr:hypothetical protein PHYSODRAFT_299773 [Phytophthora sojae]EGZ22549.1 hypothetical protein PHYSODRAFT_299773 [Phytophthora sojae]|eukprot:XP_009525266.1 hypothetical protein PHYSODRAFT_299773 [Phytophthora sojae]
MRLFSWADIARRARTKQKNKRLSYFTHVSPAMVTVRCYTGYLVRRPFDPPSVVIGRTHYFPREPRILQYTTSLANATSPTRSWSLRLSKSSSATGKRLSSSTRRFIATLAGSYAAIQQGVDLRTLAKRVPFVDLSRLDSDTGTLALAYVSTVATGPPRCALTIAASPVLARLLSRSRGIPSKSGKQRKRTHKG